MQKIADQYHNIFTNIIEKKMIKIHYPEFRVVYPKISLFYVATQ